ncbi:hypothetical protein QUF64_10770 [Anaerolineales bacterium HSG6]|nr:hypothetical protein [Anaerolineales bacterium HSG6]
MLDIRFYSTTGKAPGTLDLSESFYQWLLKSEFSKIGISRPQTIRLDEEEVLLQVVDLNKGQVPNRHRFRAFLVEAIVQESNRMLTQLGEAPSPQTYQTESHTLRNLQQLRHYIEDEAYQFLERV